MKSVIYKKLETSRPLRKKQPAASVPGFITVPDGQEKLIYSVEMDFEMLHGMARQAARNKSGRSSDGPLTVRIVSRRRVDGNAQPLEVQP